MPTIRRRHFVAETPRVEAALSQLRNELGSDRIDLSEIVVLGAERKLEQVREQRADNAALRRSLAARMRARTLPVDTDAATRVRATGWTRG